jgi:predicted DNA-binding transcriptional regulator AlpA
MRKAPGDVLLDDFSEGGAVVRSIDDLPELSKRAELAEFTGTSIPTLARWAVEGVGPRVTRLGGGSVRYRKRDVLAWLDSLAEAG